MVNNRDHKNNNFFANIKCFGVLISLFLLISYCPSTMAQGLHTSSNKAAKIYNQAMKAYDYFELDEAERLFLQAVSIDPKFFESYMMLGELYTKLNKNKDAAENYIKAVNIDSISFRPVFFALAEVEFLTGDYQNALKHYRSYINSKGIQETNKKKAEKNIKNCLFSLDALKNPVNVTLVDVGGGINTQYDEYWPSISIDGQTMLSQEDLYISIYDNDAWQEAQGINSPLNTADNEGAQTLSSAGDYMFFTACNRRDGMGSCDIYFSALRNGKWTAPYNIGDPVNTRHWESTPSINANGNMLIFSSNRPGGFGGKDLWYSILDSEGKWGEPKNMGANINTPYDETSPFIHFDGYTLYFSSDGWPGMGGMDLFMSKLNADSTWSEPVNLGYPINTYGDEMGMIVNANSDVAFFSLKRDDSLGKDIYSFALEKELRPNLVSYMKGRVFDKQTETPITAELELINLSDNSIALLTTTDAQGNFLISLPSNNNYGINISKEGYLFFSESFLFQEGYQADKPYVKNIYLQQIDVGEELTMKNVFFEFNTWMLKTESHKELDNLVKLLKQNPSLKIEIGGHTDNIGGDEYNISLSEKRANSVANYLIENGIDANKLVCKGYGSTKPISDNDTEQGRSLNRRTEIVIISK